MPESVNLHTIVIIYKFPYQNMQTQDLKYPNARVKISGCQKIQMLESQYLDAAMLCLGAGVRISGNWGQNI